MVYEAFLGSIQEWGIVLLVLVLLFGAKKIPELARSMGSAVGEMQKGLKESQQSLADPPAAPATPTATTEQKAE